MNEAGKFHRSLNLFDSTAIVIGSMIGSGIFIVSADMARNLGSPGWMLIVWIISGLMTIAAALSYGELAGIMPKAGGIYVYLREAYSPLFGFLYGWTLFIVIQSGTISAVAMAFGKYLGVLVPGISEDHIFFRLGTFTINFNQLIAIFSVLLLTWINSKGIEQGKKVQNVFTFSKIFILLIFVLIGLVFTKPFVSQDWWQASKSANGIQIPIEGLALIAAIGMSMVGALFSSDAWYDLTFTSGEVKNPRRTIPRALFLGTLVVSIFYFLINLVYIKALPVHGFPNGTNIAEQGIQFATEDRVATAVMWQILGYSAGIIMAVVVVISTFGCNNGLILSGARVYYAMAGDNLFFKRAAKLNDKGVPEFGLWMQAIWCTLLCLSGSYLQLLDYVIFAALIFNILTVSAVFIMRYKQPGESKRYKTFGYPIIPLFYIALCITIEIILLKYKPEFTRRGLYIVIAGIPVYYGWKYRAKIAELFRK